MNSKENTMLHRLNHDEVYQRQMQYQREPLIDSKEVNQKITNKTLSSLVTQHGLTPANGRLASSLFDENSFQPSSSFFSPQTQNSKQMPLSANYHQVNKMTDEIMRR